MASRIVGTIRKLMSLARSTPDAAEAALAEQRANEMMLRHGVHVKPEDTDLVCEIVQSALGEYWRERLLIIVALGHGCGVISVDKQAAMRGQRGDVVQAMALYMRLRATLCAAAAEQVQQVVASARPAASGMFLNAAVSALSEKFDLGVKDQIQPARVPDAAAMLNMIDRTEEASRLKQEAADLVDRYGYYGTKSVVEKFEAAGRWFGERLDVEQRKRLELTAESSFAPPRNSYGEVTRLRASLLEID